ncbi:two-component system sensor histidine kinase YesM [Streptohalobacillus salinus]|uniref:histidine kinase n=1 Tax=Streptohalobacillus salinus TaxID=621096 RepID=A0A2V3WAR9_9BACI|nr:sensor histidine kinase [Streptohalobacillus salinus]PXW91503.1 two-component system sensor histidine kinase YesM [Streptohalobacillus salinus]
MRWIKEKLLDLKISYKLMSVYLLVTALPLILVGVHLNVSVRDVVVNNAIFETEANLEKIELQLENIVNRVTHISDLIYLNRDLDTLLRGEYETTFEMYQAYDRYPIFNDFLRFYDELENIQFFMVRPMISDSYFISATEDITSSDWFEQAKAKEGRISWIIKEEHWTREKYLTLTRAVYGQNEQFLGVLNIYVSMEKIRQVVDSEIHEVYITLDNQEIIYSTNQEQQFQHPTFMQGLTGEDRTSNLIYDETIDGEEVKVNLHRLRPEKSLENELQIATLIPVEVLMEEPNAIFKRGYLIMFAALIVSIVAFQLFIKTFNSRINTLKSAMGRVARGKFNIEPRIIGKDEIGEAYDQLYQTSQSLQTLIDEVYVHKIKEERWYRQQKESEFKMLSSQINPHFLYNTLEMIRMKALVNDDREVATLIKKLSKMMRSALERVDRPVPLEDELDLIETYLEIQAMRFGEKLSYHMDVRGSTKDVVLFPLLIQPLVENAIIHGLEPKEDRGHLVVNVDIDELLTIQVIDDGVGMDSERLQKVKDNLSVTDHLDGKRIGIRNVHQRIQLFYGQAYGLTLSSEKGVGTTMTIRLPIQ